MEAKNIEGNADLKDIQGSVSLDRISGDLKASNLRGGTEAGDVEGDINLSLSLTSEGKYHFEANGDIRLNLGRENSVRLTARTEGGEISYSTEEGIPFKVEKSSERELIGTVGDGKAEITLMSQGGNVRIELGKGAEWGDFERLGQKIQETVEEAMKQVDFSQIGKQIEEAMKGIDFEEMGRHAEQMGRRGEEFAQRIRERMERMGRRMEERMRKHAGKWEGKAWPWDQPGWHWPWEEEGWKWPWEEEGWPWEQPSPPTEERERKVTVEEPEKRDLEAERLAILKMVESGKISPEEGDKLLEALERRE